MQNIRLHILCAINSKCFLWLIKYSLTCFTDVSLTLFLIPFLPSLLHSSQPVSFYLKHIKSASASVLSFFPTPGTLLPRTLQESFQFVHIIWNTDQKHHHFQEVSLDSTIKKEYHTDNSVSPLPWFAFIFK